VPLAATQQALPAPGCVVAAQRPVPPCKRPGAGRPAQAQRPACPQVVETNRSMALFAKEVVALALQHRADGFVVGLPVQAGSKLTEPWKDSAQVAGACASPCHRRRAAARRLLAGLDARTRCGAATWLTTRVDAPPEPPNPTPPPPPVCRQASRHPDPLPSPPPVCAQCLQTRQCRHFAHDLALAADEHGMSVYLVSECRNARGGGVTW